MSITIAIRFWRRSSPDAVELALFGLARIADDVPDDGVSVGEGRFDRAIHTGAVLCLQMLSYADQQAAQLPQGSTMTADMASLTGYCQLNESMLFCFL